MRTKKDAKPKLTDTERHERFKDMAREVEASEDPADFEKAFEEVTRRGSPLRRNEPPESS